MAAFHHELQRRRNVYASLPTRQSSSPSCDHHGRKRRRKFMPLIALNCLLASAYFLLSSATFPEQQQQQQQQQQRRSLSLTDSLTSAVGLDHWSTWSVTQQTFRSLCSFNSRSGEYHQGRSLSVLDALLPGFFTQGDTRLSRFLSCNVGFSCSYKSERGYAQCYDGSGIIPVPPTGNSDYKFRLRGGCGCVSCTAYVMSISTCPEDVTALTNPWSIDNRNFYDTYAIARHSICNVSAETDDPLESPVTADAFNRGNWNSISQYNESTYAFIHHDALVCDGPDGEKIDMVGIMKDLGYCVKEMLSPIGAGDLSIDTPNTFIRDNIKNDNVEGGLKELIKLRALGFNDTHHPLVVLVESTTTFLQPIDEIYDSMLNDPTINATYIRGADGLYDTGAFIFKPSRFMFQDAIETYINTPFTDTGGWNGTGIGAGPIGSGGMSTKGFLTYFFDEARASEHPSTEMNKCIYGNAMEPACAATPYDQVKIARFNTDACEPAWKCDDSGHTNGVLCQELQADWVRKRVNFENNHWHLTPFASRKGMYRNEDTFDGFCENMGKEHYHHMLEWEGQPRTNGATVWNLRQNRGPQGVPHQPQPWYLDEALLGCGMMDCGSGNYITPDCSCSPNPCDACPRGTRCQNNPGLGLPPMCIDCQCGFVSNNDRSCCEGDGQGHCKPARGHSPAWVRFDLIDDCQIENNFFSAIGPLAGYNGLTEGTVCTIELTYNAVPMGCGCEPSQSSPCTYDPNDRSWADRDNICTAQELLPLPSVLDEEHVDYHPPPYIGGDEDTETTHCTQCKICLNNCETTECLATADELYKVVACLGRLPDQCRDDCLEDCRHPTIVNVM